MHLLPWFREEFYSPLPPTELLRRLQASTAPSLNEVAPGEQHQTATFQGWVKPAGIFRLSRLSRHKNRYGQRSSAMTVVEGAVSASDSGSRLRLLHRPALFALFALGFWLVLDSVGVTVSLIGWLRNQPEYASWGPVIVFICMLALFLLIFWWEVWQERTILVQLLDLHPAAPA